ncbi:MAG: molecular chaperone DnaJ [Methylococcales bacterium]|nr:molecular chaperone DnaJ [Methylococcales bacterium]
MLPEEKALKQLLGEQAQLEEKVKDGELLLASRKAENTQFQDHYYQSIGLLYVELDRLNARLARAEALSDLNNPLAQEKATLAEKQAQLSAEEAGVIPKPTPAPEKTPQLEHAFALATQLMSPDMGISGAEHERRAAFMAQVNTAYTLGKTDLIEKHILAFRHDPDAITASDTASRLVKTIRRIAQLKQRLLDIEQEIGQLNQGELAELMALVTEAKASGVNLLADLALRIRQQIAECTLQLNPLA